MPSAYTFGDRRRDAILEFVEQYWTDHGYAPCIREIARAVGLRAPSSALRQVRILVDAGCLSMTPGIQRSIRVVET